MLLASTCSKTLAGVSCNPLPASVGVGWLARAGPEWASAVAVAAATSTMHMPLSLGTRL
eukprot:SAG11_NODE_8132_length_1057_cov_1.060543_1_plen_58_part_10